MMLKRDTLQSASDFPQWETFQVKHEHWWNSFCRGWQWKTRELLHQLPPPHALHKIQPLELQSPLLRIAVLSPLVTERSPTACPQGTPTNSAQTKTAPIKQAL